MASPEPSPELAGVPGTRKELGMVSPELDCNGCRVPEIA